MPRRTPTRRTTKNQIVLYGQTKDEAPFDEVSFDEVQPEIQPEIQPEVEKVNKEGVSTVSIPAPSTRDFRPEKHEAYINGGYRGRICAAITSFIIFNLATLLKVYPGLGTPTYNCFFKDDGTFTTGFNLIVCVVMFWHLWRCWAALSKFAPLFFYYKWIAKYITYDLEPNLLGVWQTNVRKTRRDLSSYFMILVLEIAFAIIISSVYFLNSVTWFQAFTLGVFIGFNSEHRIFIIPTVYTLCHGVFNFLNWFYNDTPVTPTLF